MEIERYGMIIDVLDIAQTLPSINKDNIERDNLIQTIDLLFQEGIGVVIVEGSEGSGKSILLRQFCEKHRKNTFSLSVSGSNSLSYDLANIRYDLCNQINWYLNGKQLNYDEDVDDSYLRSYSLKLMRVASRRREKIYFVVDVKEVGSKNVYENILTLFDGLPVGQKYIKFLLSNDLGGVLSEKYCNIGLKYFQLPRFSFHEVETYFRDICKDKEFIEDVYKVTTGLPSHLGAIRRVLETGVSVDTLKDDMPEHLKDIFEIEWRRLNDLENDLSIPLAILSFDNYRHSINDIALLTNVEVDVLINDFGGLSFINYDVSTGFVSFISDDFRLFAMEELKGYKSEVEDLVINNMLSKKDEKRSLSNLPEYLKKAERYDDLLNVIDINHFKKLLKATSTLSYMKKQAEIGVDAAYESKNESELVRLSLISSVVSEFGVSHEKKYEIEAYISMMKYEVAINIASSASLIEDRLYLLSVVARAIKSSGKSVEVALKDQIESHYKKMDSDLLDEDKALDIAGELFSVFPEYAVDLVERTVESEGGENSLDHALAKLSLRTIENHGLDKGDTEHLNELSSRINNKTLKSFMSTANTLSSDAGFNSVITEIDKLEKTGEKLFFIKTYIDGLTSFEYSFDLVEYALKLAITSTDYSPNAGLYRILSKAIKGISSSDKRESLIGYIDGQNKSIKSIGPTNEYIRMQLNLAEAESLSDIEKSKQRIINVYLDDVEELSNIIIKTSCLAWFMATLVKIDPDKKIEDDEGVYSVVEDELKKNIDLILDSTAEQYHAVKDIIYALAPVCFEYVEKVSDHLNAVSRRDKAYLEILTSISDNNEFSNNIESSIDIINKITDLNDKRDGIFLIIDSIEENKCLINNNEIRVKVFGLIDYIPSAEDRFYAAVLLYNSMDIDDKDSLFSLEEKAKIYWEKIPDELDKINITFRCVSILSGRHISLAKKYMALAEDIKRSSIVTCDKDADVLKLMVHLLLRSYRCLVESKLDNEDDFIVIKNIIYQLDSLLEQIKMWTHVCSYFYLLGDERKSKELVFKYIKPLLDSVDGTNKGILFNALTYASPVIWLAHKETFYELIKGFPSYVCDIAHYRIFRFVLVRDIPGEPTREITTNRHDVQYSELLDSIELLSHMDEDSRIYICIKAITEIVLKRFGDGKVSRSQIGDIENRLYKVINTKLPNLKYIKHDGYKISSLAQVNRLNKKSKKWDGLVKDADNITNISDRIIVYSFISSAMPNKLMLEKKKLIKKANNLIEKIPDLYDQIDRYETLSECALDFDVALSKDLLKKAFSISLDSNDEELKRKQRGLIDMAYKYDSDLPASLASLANDDPAIKKASHKIDTRLDHLKLRGRISDERKDKIDNKTKIEGMPDASWDRLGALFSGKISPIHFDRIKQLISQAALFPLSDAYPIYSYAIENIRLTYKNTEQSKKYCLPMFEVNKQAVEILLEILSHKSGLMSNTILSSSNTSNGNGLIVKVGERDEAIKYIKNWLLSLDNLTDIEICDPYFGLDELEMLNLVLEVSPHCRVVVLTSESYQNTSNLSKPWDDAYKNHWKYNVSDQDPLDTEIIICGIKPNGNMPVHDRWIITNDSGIRLGTSLNSLGKKVSEISLMNESEAAIAHENILPYMTKREKMHDGNRISYLSFDLY